MATNPSNPIGADKFSDAPLPASLERKLLPPENPWKARFKKLGVKQRSVAYALGLSPSYVSDLFRGWRPITDDIELSLQALYVEISIAQTAEKVSA